MNKDINVKSLALGAVLGIAVCLSVAAAANANAPTNWEYRLISARVFQNELQNGINGAVSEGWEFVSASPYVDQYGFAVLRREKK
jgi:hypothetical protein